MQYQICIKRETRMVAQIIYYALLNHCLTPLILLYCQCICGVVWRRLGIRCFKTIGYASCAIVNEVLCFYWNRDEVICSHKDRTKQICLIASYEVSITTSADAVRSCMISGQLLGFKYNHSIVSRVICNRSMLVDCHFWWYCCQNLCDRRTFGLRRRVDQHRCLVWW